MAKIVRSAKNLSHDARSNFGPKGWWIIILDAMTFFIFTSTISLSMNVVVEPKAVEMGLDYGTLLALNTPAGIIGLFATLVLSVLANKFGLKTVHVISLLIGAVMCVLWGNSSSLVGYAVPLIILFCIMSSTEVVTGRIMANWFPRKKGIATGWATMGLNAASLLAIPAMTAVLAITGQAKYVMYLLASWILLVMLLTIFAYKDYPEQWGAYPDNDPSFKVEDLEGSLRTGWTIKSVFTNRSIWAISIATGFVGMAIFGFVTTLIPNMMTKDFSQPTAILMMSVSSIAGFFGSYIFGFIDQKFSCKLGNILLSAWMLIGVVFYFLPGTICGWIFILVFGIALGASNNYPISITTQVFGRAGFKVAWPVVYFIKGFLCYLPHAINGWSMSTFGNYKAAWLIFGVAIIISLIMFLIMDMNPKQDPIEYASNSVSAE